jgi:hypothetical protein
MRPNPATKCTCNKCGAVDLSTIPNKPHRRCGGAKNTPLREPDNRLPGNERGTWKVPEEDEGE